MTSKKPQIPLIWHADNNKTVSEDLSERNRAVVDEFARLIKAGARETVLKAVRRMPPPSMVSLFVHLPLKRARKLTSWLDQPQLRIIAELNPSFRAALLDDVAVQRLIDVLDGFEPEEAADALDDLPDEVAEQVLPRLRERETIETLRGYGEESAGSIMSRKFVAVPVDWTVGQVTADIRANAEAIEKLYAVNVVDAEQRPVGYLRLRDLLLAPKETPVEQIMQTDFVAVGPETDQEEVARFADRYELSVVPVVDRDGRLIGRITPKQLRRVLREEAEEDLNLMSGLPADSRPDQPIRRIIRGRIPWLLAGLAGATLSAAVVGAFEEQLAKAAILASFIPIVMSMAGNAGIQAATVAVQGLSSGTVTFADLGWRLGKELIAALANGAIAASVLILLVLLATQFIEVQHPIILALTAGLSLLSVILVAVLVGASIPILLERVGIDPAMATGVFITTGNDIISVALFFLLMMTFYL
ncbi:MAG: magnesium transporter [Lamprobacter sp.]|uniref:magnesium transporter n=1 Tax=Lamprobacter sp. TaxID=3100796 RepID=UPI002B261697|nr:magnesium transporter [Lamprobacter sp.]MEA3639148.1 magnesium transporter [Lamprobacter sp.]